MATIKINFPQVVDATDYHDFAEMADVLKRFSGQNVKYKEITKDGDHWYYAVFYIGVQPDKQTISKLLSDKTKK